MTNCRSSSRFFDDDQEYWAVRMTFCEYHGLPKVFNAGMRDCDFLHRTNGPAVSWEAEWGSGYRFYYFMAPPV